MKSLFKATWQHIRRSPYQALAAISVMVLNLFVISVFLVSALASSVILSYFESKPQITAFFSSEKKPEDIRSLSKKLEDTGMATKIKYVSKEEALTIYREQNKKDTLLLEMVTANILPSSLEVSARDPKNLGNLASVLEKEPGVTEVVYQKDIIDSLISWTQALRKIGLILVSFLTIISLLIILTVVGMKIALRKEEIEILKIIGAPNWYIRLPFLFEGIFYGLSGAVISFTILMGLVFYFTPYLSRFIGEIPLLPIRPVFILELFGGALSIGILVGTIGSFFAVWRYLKS